MTGRAFEHPLPMRPDVLADLRAQFGDWLTARHADDESAQDLLIVLSELGASQRPHRPLSPRIPGLRC